MENIKFIVLDCSIGEEEPNAFPFENKEDASQIKLYLINNLEISEKDIHVFAVQNVDEFFKEEDEKPSLGHLARGARSYSKYGVLDGITEDILSGFLNESEVKKVIKKLRQNYDPDLTPLELNNLFFESLAEIIEKPKIKKEPA